MRNNKAFTLVELLVLKFIT
ncbi:MAG: prepilin-type N-terminal cleavage/methylation domain-containing protein [Planctomycetota bacterium]